MTRVTGLGLPVTFCLHEFRHHRNVKVKSKLKASVVAEFGAVPEGSAPIGVFGDSPT